MAAKRIIDEIAPPRQPPPEEGVRAFDVVLLEACREGRAISNNRENNDSSGANGKSLRCLTVNPELMHHRPGDSLIAGVDSKPRENLNKHSKEDTMKKDEEKKAHRPPVDVAADEVIARTGETANIECGFLDGAFDWMDGDRNRDGDGDGMSEEELEKLRYLREEVGVKGRCLKEGRGV